MTKPPKKLIHEQNKAKSSLQRIFFVKGADFTGDWVMNKVEGDMDKMLTKMGMNAMERQAARMYNYGVGHVTEKIKQDGDDLVITTKSLMGTEEKQYKTGEETEMEIKSAKKKKKATQMTCKTSWADANK